MKLSNKQKKAVTGAVDDIFFGLKARLLGRFFKGPAIFFEAVKASDPLATLEGIYRYTLQLTNGPGFEPDEDNLKDLAEITNNYIEAERLKTQNEIFNDIIAADVPKDIKESVKKRLDKATNYLDTLLTTETRVVQAYAEKEGITQVAASLGVEDPIVVKLGIIDDKLCDNCKKLWHMEDNINIPKVYKLSELQEGYNKDWKNPVPTLGPTHPHCFSRDTKVLTRRGWILFEEVEASDEFLSVDLKTGNADWVKHIGLLKYYHQGQMLSFRNHRVNLMTTMEHNQVIRKRHKKGEYSYSLSKYEQTSKADSLCATIPDWIGTDLNPVFDNEEYNSREFAEFLGYYLSEGCLTYGSKGTVRVEITQKKYPEPMIKSMEKIFKSEDIYNKHEKTIKYIKKETEMANFLKSLGKSHEKYVPDFIKNAKKETIRVFLDAFRLGDGSKREPRGFGKEGEVLYHTSSPQLSADIGEMILKLGKKPSYSSQEPRPIHHKNGTYTAKRPCYTIRENKLPYSLLMNCEITTVDYDDYVYDVELERWHTLFVQREGKVCLSGNCRHVLSYVAPNFGFDSSGRITFIKFGHDEWKKQRGED